MHIDFTVMCADINIPMYYALFQLKKSVNLLKDVKLFK